MTRRVQRLTRPAGTGRDAAPCVSQFPARLPVVPAGDRSEHAADRLAASALSGPRPTPVPVPAPGPAFAPAVVDDVLRSSGAPLDAAAGRELAHRFGHDFSGVRVHTDEHAAASARAVNATAYTVGRDIVFDRGAYAPGTPAGRRLLAHELAHVVQQRGGISRLMRQPAAQPANSPAPARPGGLDAAAQAIVDLAQDAGRPLAERAPAVVRRLLDAYYAGDAPLVDSIRYDAAEPGLSVTYTRETDPAQRKGILTVGDYFVNQTLARHFARRVAQLGHEIQHIHQQRSGMTGASRSDEREFRAFHWEALFTEPAGTGRMQRAMRLRLVDVAIGYYHCLDGTLRRDLAAMHRQLVDRRATEAASVSPAPGPAPTECRRQH